MIRIENLIAELNLLVNNVDPVHNKEGSSHKKQSNKSSRKKHKK